MTDAPTAILATFFDLRLVKSRKTAQLVFELPMEKLKEALDTLGMPDPAGDVWCGIARVHANKTDWATADGAPIEGKFMGDASTRKDEALEGRFRVPPKADLSKSPTKPKKRWHDMPASQRAGMLMNDEKFRAFVSEVMGLAETPASVIVANEFIKTRCNVVSKSDLKPGAYGHDRYLEIEGNFRAWRLAKQLGAA